MFNKPIVFLFLVLTTSRNLTTDDDPLIAQVWFLNNGGEILSNYEDWITWEMSPHTYNNILVCG